MMVSRTVYRRGVVALVAGLLVLVSTQAAHAISFKLEDYDVTLRQSDPGLVLWERDLLEDPYEFDLSAVGETETVSLFRVGTKETALNFDDLIPRSIDVEFSFTAPPPAFGGNAAGITGAFWWGDSFGYVLWNNPLVLAFGNYGLLGITLSNATFDLPGSASVFATFELLRADGNGSPTPTPEPSAALLLLIGLGIFLVSRRRAILSSR
jgi:hypothetical protein